MDLSSVHDAIKRYAQAVQEADVDKLRSVPCGVLREQLPLEDTALIVTQLAADTCQYGAIAVSNFRDASVGPEQCTITATVNFEQAPSLDVRFGLIERHGRWLLVGAHAVPEQCRRRHSAAAS